MSEKKRTFNPIDPEKIAENANLLRYGSSVSAPAFQAVDTLKNKSLDVNAMEMQTDMQLDQIRQQAIKMTQELEAAHHQSLVHIHLT